MQVIHVSDIGVGQWKKTIQAAAVRERSERHFYLYIRTSRSDCGC